MIGGRSTYRSRTPHRPRQDQLNTGEKSSGPLSIFTTVALDLFSDGIMIGTGSFINPALGLLLAAEQVPADFLKVSPRRPPTNAQDFPAASVF